MPQKLDAVRSAKRVTFRLDIVEVLTYLRDDEGCQFEVLIDICGVDWPQREKRFDVVYHLLSLRRNQRIRVKSQTDETTPVPSVVGVYPAANWYEREAYDMYGILFSGHPDLRRMLTDYGFQGYPAAQGFPAHRLRRGALRRRAEARRLRAGRADAGIPQRSISRARGKASTTCFPVMKRRRRNNASKVGWCRAEVVKW